MRPTVATAEESYCDSSALRALYLHDPRTRAMVINHGSVVFDGTPAEMESKAPAHITKNRMDHVFRMLTTGDRATLHAKHAKGARR